MRHYTSAGRYDVGVFLSGDIIAHVWSHVRGRDWTTGSVRRITARGQHEAFSLLIKIRSALRGKQKKTNLDHATAANTPSDESTEQVNIDTNWCAKFTYLLEITSKAGQTDERTIRHARSLRKRDSPARYGSRHGRIGFSFLEDIQ